MPSLTAILLFVCIIGFLYLAYRIYKLEIRFKKHEKWSEETFMKYLRELEKKAFEK